MSKPPRKPEPSRKKLIGLSEMPAAPPGADPLELHWLALMIKLAPDFKPYREWARKVLGADDPGSEWE